MPTGRPLAGHAAYEPAAKEMAALATPAWSGTHDTPAGAVTVQLAKKAAASACDPENA